MRIGGAQSWNAPDGTTDADVVFVYGVPSILGKLERKLTAEMKVGSFVVSNAFPFAAMPPPNGTTRALSLLDKQFVEVGRGALDESSAVFLYGVVCAAGDDGA